MMSIVEGKVIEMRESMRRGDVTVNEISIAIELDTPVRSDEIDGLVSALGEGAMASVPEPMLYPFLERTS